MLRRDAHAALDSSVRRNQRGWHVLAHLHERALSSVRYDVTAVDGVRRLHLDRSDISMPAVGAGKAGKAVVVHGESGVGKSALVLAAATTQPNATQAVCINLRQLPNTTVEFESLLGCPLAILLAELSAPERLLVIDAADAVAEGMLEQFRPRSRRSSTVSYITPTCRSVGHGAGAPKSTRICVPRTPRSKTYLSWSPRPWSVLKCRSVAGFAVSTEAKSSGRPP
jgi:hypothetical protein